MNNLDLNLASVCMELANTDEVFIPISKEEIKECFFGKTIINELGKPDDSFVEGEVQYVFDKAGNLNEILIFPVYFRDGGYTNGDYINAPDKYWEHREAVKSFLDSRKTSVSMSKEMIIEAFETSDWITGSLTGGIEAPRIIKGVTITENTAEVRYTYHKTCGLSDCRYHDLRAGKDYTDLYEMKGNKLLLNGSEDIFGLDGWRDKELISKAVEFFNKWNLVVTV